MDDDEWYHELRARYKMAMSIKAQQGSHMALCRALFGSSWWFMSWLVLISSDSCHGLWWFMSWFMVVHVMVCGDSCHGLW